MGREGEDGFVRGLWGLLLVGLPLDFLGEKS